MQAGEVGSFRDLFLRGSFCRGGTYERKVFDYKQSKEGFSGGKTSREGKELGGRERRSMATMDPGTYFIGIQSHYFSLSGSCGLFDYMFSFMVHGSCLSYGFTIVISFTSLGCFESNAALFQLYHTSCRSFALFSLIMRRPQVHPPTAKSVDQNTKHGLGCFILLCQFMLCFCLDIPLFLVSYLITHQFTSLHLRKPDTVGIKYLD